ncbi:MAG: energy transducer TonB [Treponema sp.]|nr:energy transducer TonB [Treponema sp.]
MSEKIVSKIIKYSSCMRPILFGLVFILHAVLIFVFNIRTEEELTETVDLRDAEIFKLVDIREYEQPPRVVEKKVVTVNQEKASENIVETEKEVVKQEETVYLPQHKISSVPVIPGNQILSRIVYPPMALKQGIEAVVYLELYIDGEGTIRKIKVLKDPGHGFAEAAVKALDGLKCIPASANGKSVAVRYRYPVKFTLH